MKMYINLCGKCHNLKGWKVDGLSFELLLTLMRAELK